jgi:hypothetical protein
MPPPGPGEKTGPRQFIKNVFKDHRFFTYNLIILGVVIPLQGAAMLVDMHLFDDILEKIIWATGPIVIIYHALGWMAVRFLRNDFDHIRRFGFNVLFFVVFFSGISLAFCLAFRMIWEGLSGMTF